MSRFFTHSFVTILLGFSLTLAACAPAIPIPQATSISRVATTVTATGITRPLEATATIPVPTQAAVTLLALDPLARLGKGAVDSLALSKDGRWLAVKTPLGVYLYETATQQEIWFLPLTGNGLTFSPDGEKLAIGNQDAGVLVVKVANGEGVFHIHTYENGQPDWSPDGTKLLTSAGCEEVKVWDAQTGAPLTTVQEPSCNNVVPGIVRAAWSGDGNKVYVNSDNSYVLAYDAHTNQPLTGYDPHPPEYSFGLEIAPSPTQDLFAIENGLSIAIMDGSSGELVKSLEGNRQDVPLRGITWSPDGRQLAANNGYEITIWDMETGQQVHNIRASSHPVSMAWMPDDKTLVVAEDNNLHAVDLETGEIIFTLPGFGRINNYSATPIWEGDQLLTFDGIHSIYWDARSGTFLKQEPAPAKAAWVLTEYGYYAVSPDASRYASPDTVFRVLDNQPIVHLNDTSENVYDKVAWSPDNTVLVSGYSLGGAPLTLWDANTGQPLMDFSTGNPNFYLGALAFSPDGKMLAAGGAIIKALDQGTLILWDAKTGERTHNLTAGMGSEHIMSLAWSPDGHWLAAGMYSGRIILWDMFTLQPAANLIGHKGHIIGLSWSPDGQLLASNSFDGTVLVWGIP